MIDLLDEIRAGKIRAGDGGMGTMLQSAGLDDGGAPVLRSVVLPVSYTHLTLPTTPYV